jgi:uncharacterized HAD superfamily protein
MKIGIDLDDTISNSRDIMVQFHNKLNKSDFSVNDIKKYNLWDNWGGTLETTIKELEKFHHSDYANNIKPLAGAKEVLENLKKNNELYIITARANSIKKDTEEWIEKYFPNIFSKIYFTNEFSHGVSEITKKKICDNLDIDIYIEDNLEFALECAEPNRKVFLIDHPWNQTDKLPANIKRVKSWKEINIKQ